MVVLLFGARNTSTAGISVTDSRGNKWTIDAGPFNTANNLCFIASTMQTAGTLQTSDTVTITCGTAPTNRMGLLEEFSGVTNGTRVDRTTSNASSTAVGYRPGPGWLLAGFWLGLWQGLISPITFLISLFTSEVNIYEVQNISGPCRRLSV
jgi:hypothetical protein